MNTKLILGLYIALAVVQIAMPIGQIRKYEDVLRTGRPYKFLTAPVDPYDAFRGRYVALNYAGTMTTVRAGDKIGRRSPAYVTLRQDENGFAQFGDLAVEPPMSADYLRVTYLYSRPDNRAFFRLPFDRFFMEESMAPKAERAYRNNLNRRGQQSGQTYVLVRVKDGRGVIENLFVRDQPIQEFLTKGMP